MAEYESFAAVYDRLMDDFDYPKWAEYYLSLLKNAGAKSDYIVECGCGTGSLSVEFARRGSRVLGIDKSGDMLEIAASRARTSGVKLMLANQDMTQLTVGRRADAVLATCDAVNYLTTPAAVSAFFKSAYAALRPGGVLAFDVSSPHKLENVIGNAPFFEERDDIVYLWKNSLDPDSHVLCMELTFFVQEEGGLYRRFEETHRQRAHRADELCALLAEAGFTDIHTYGDRTFDAPGEEELRIHITAKK